MVRGAVISKTGELQEGTSGFASPPEASHVGPQA